jgi:hypothetical protein
MSTKQAKYGIIAGFLLIFMTVVASFSYAYIHNKLVVNSSEITLKNLLSNKSFFYAELAGWILIFITDIIVAIALYFYFIKTSKQISFITAVIRILYTLILGVAILQLIKIIPIISSNNSLSNHLNIFKTTFYLQFFQKIWSLGLVIFGFHLLGLAYLSVKSKTIPKLLSYLLYFGGVSYSFIHISQQLVLFKNETLNLIENFLVLPMALSEIFLAIWLIYNGIQKPFLKVKS